MPPFSGFAAKFAVISAGVADSSTVVVVAALIAGVLTLLSMTKIWLGVFWGPDPEPDERAASAPGNRSTMLTATGLAVAGTLAISLFAGPLFDLSQQAADELRAQATIVIEDLS